MGLFFTLLPLVEAMTADGPQWITFSFFFEKFFFV